MTEPPPVMNVLPACYGQYVQIEPVTETPDGRFVGLRILGPRKGIQAAAWFQSPHALDDVIAALQRERRRLSEGSDA